MQGKVRIRSRKRVYENAFLSLPREIVYQMCQNQVTLNFYNIVSHKQDRAISRMAEWCDLNCKGIYRVDDHTFFFELEEDMTGFKLAYEGDIEV